MAEPSGELPVHPFECFPRQDLTGGITRRQFFQTLLKEFELYGQRAHGAVAFRVGELGVLSDAALNPLRPRILPGWRVSIQDGALYARSGTGSPVRLFVADRLSISAFNCINGRTSLAEIACQVQELGPLPPERAFAFTRGLFLTLVKAGVCLPVNAPLAKPHV